MITLGKGYSINKNLKPGYNQLKKLVQRSFLLILKKKKNCFKEY